MKKAALAASFYTISLTRLNASNMTVLGCSASHSLRGLGAMVVIAGHRSDNALISSYLLS